VSHGQRIDAVQTTTEAGRVDKVDKGAALAVERD